VRRQSNELAIVWILEHFGRWTLRQYVVLWNIAGSTAIARHTPAVCHPEIHDGAATLSATIKPRTRKPEADGPSKL
jgi:hypothetical protein